MLSKSTKTVGDYRNKHIHTDEDDEENEQSNTQWTKKYIGFEQFSKILHK
jgi:hypothetical protein